MISQIADIYDTLPVEDLAKQCARTAADALDNFLDSPAGVAFNNETLTNRRIFEVFMYGSITHANEDKRALYESWTEGPMSLILQTFFEDIAARIIQAVLSSVSGIVVTHPEIFTHSVGGH